MSRWKLLILFGWLLSAAVFYFIACGWKAPESGVIEVPTGTLYVTNSASASEYIPYRHDSSTFVDSPRHKAPEWSGWFCVLSNGVDHPVAVAKEVDGRLLELPVCENERLHKDAVYYQATSSNFTNVITNTFGFGEIYDEDRRLHDARALYYDAKEYGALTNLVSLLTLSGEFCRIQGHAWTANLRGYLPEQLDKPEWRECLVCGREEERARSDKPWHHSNP